MRKQVGLSARAGRTPRGRTATERAEIGRRRSIALLDVETLHQRIMRAQAGNLDDAAVLLRRVRTRGYAA